jgi:hypothetical protein
MDTKNDPEVLGKCCKCVTEHSMKTSSLQKKPPEVNMPFSAHAFLNQPPQVQPVMKMGVDNWETRDEV